MEFKGITWAGNLYQKFEAMCLEVEEVMYQDTAIYLENQVQTVGASVKKFYSEVMQDFLPPSHIDPVKVAAADLPLNPYSHTEFNKKPKQSIREYIKEVKTKKAEDCEKMADVNAERATSFAQLDSEVHHMPMFDGDSRINRCLESYSGKRKIGGLYRRPIVSSKRSSNRDHPSKMSGLCIPVSAFHEIKSEVPSASVEVHGTREAKNGSRLTDKDVSISNASLDSPDSDTNSSLETVTQKQADPMSTTTSQELSSESIDTGTNAAMSEGKEELTVSCEGRSYNCDTDAISNDTEPGLEFVERFAESKFEETCVLVEGCELHVVSPKEGKHKSYKKKIREAFSSKLRSTRKQEYEKLSAQYSIQAPKLESVERSMPACYEDKNSKKLEAQYIPESEWEIL